MLQKKICMLGAFAVGKTSLVSRFVHSMFSEKYHTTVGVKIDKKVVELEETSLAMILWDLHGEDRFQKVRDSYLRGMSGFLLVVDGTRRSTLNTALALRERAEDVVGAVPFVLVLNKGDLREEWEVEEEDLTKLREEGWPLIETSAKTGVGVEEAFIWLAGKLVG
jgi:small GTP-binding protein